MVDESMVTGKSIPVVTFPFGPGDPQRLAPAPLSGHAARGLSAEVPG